MCEKKKELQAAAARRLRCCWACGVSGVSVRSGPAPGAFCVCCCTRLEKYVGFPDSGCALRCPRKIELVRTPLRAERADRRCRAGAGAGGACADRPGGGPRPGAFGAGHAARARTPREHEKWQSRNREYTWYEARRCGFHCCNRRENVAMVRSPAVHQSHTYVVTTGTET